MNDFRGIGALVVSGIAAGHPYAPNTGHSRVGDVTC